MDIENEDEAKQQYGVYAVQKKICTALKSVLLSLPMTIATLASSHTSYVDHQNTFTSFSSAGNVLNTSGCIDPTSALVTTNEDIFSCINGVLCLQYFLLFLYFMVLTSPLIQYIALYDSSADTRRRAQEFFDNAKHEESPLCMLLPMVPAGLGFWFSLITLIPLFLEMSRIDAISQRIRNDNALCQPTLAQMLAYYSDIPSATCARDKKCSLRTNCIISIVFSCGNTAKAYWDIKYYKIGKEYENWRLQHYEKKVHINE